MKIKERVWIPRTPKVLKESRAEKETKLEISRFTVIFARYVPYKQCCPRGLFLFNSFYFVRPDNPRTRKKTDSVLAIFNIILHEWRLAGHRTARRRRKCGEESGSPTWAAQRREPAHNYQIAKKQPYKEHPRNKNNNKPVRELQPTAGWKD